MMTRLLSVLLLSLLTQAALAQVPPTPQNSPPYLDDPDRWEIRDENDPIGYYEVAEFWVSDWWCDYYILTTYDSRTHEPVDTGLAIDCGTNVIDVWSGDSGNWIEWHWRGDHFVKVGGTHHHREYHPSYDE